MLKSQVHYLTINVRICPRCGNPIPEGQGYSRLSSHHLGNGNLCANCALSLLDDAPPLIKLEVPRCRSCGSIRWRGRWIQQPYASDVVLDSLGHLVRDSDGIQVTIEGDDASSNSERISYTAALDVGFGLKKKLSGIVALEFSSSLCPICRMASQKEYPYLIQIRGEGRKLLDGELRDVEVMVGSLVRRFSDSPSKVEEKEGGLNVECYSPSLALILKREVEKRFMVQTLESQRLLRTERDGKKIYQRIYSMRLFRLRLGSSISMSGIVANVEGAEGRDLVMKDKDGHEFSMSMRRAFDLYRSKKLNVVNYRRAFLITPVPAMDEEDEILLETAKKAAMKAYAPYSKFKVGAALMASDGSIYTGCNVENSSYGLSMCAERVALFKAVSEGKREFLAIAVISDSGPVTPCGACRQVLFEFSPNIRVLTEGQEHSLSELLPHAFSLQDGRAPR